jgi:hypothetical protein
MGMNETVRGLRVTVLALVASAMLASACGEGGGLGDDVLAGGDPRTPITDTTGTPSDTTGTPSDTTGAPGDSTGAPSDTTGTPPAPLPLPTPLTNAQLEDLLEQEKARIDRRKNESQVVYDSLKVVWQEFLDRGGDRRATALLICDPLQYVAETKIIGPEGGDIDFGPHKLRVPAGALPWRTVITAEAPTALQVYGQFSPSGVRFLKELELHLSYQHCVLPNGFQFLRSAYVDAQFNVLELPRAEDRRNEEKVWTWFGHFSRYAVAY